MDVHEYVWCVSLAAPIVSLVHHTMANEYTIMVITNDKDTMSIRPKW